MDGRTDREVLLPKIIEPEELTLFRNQTPIYRETGRERNASVSGRFFGNTLRRKHLTRTMQPMKKYFIARKRHFYGETRRWSLGYTPTAYTSMAEAREAIKSEESEIYRLAHGEYARPDLKVLSRSQLTQAMLWEVRA